VRWFWISQPLLEVDPAAEAFFDGLKALDTVAWA
jgi:hypothetical protein